MILVSRDDFERLKIAGFIDFSSANKNYTIVNLNKKSKRKKYFVVETRAIKNFLDKK